MRPAKIHICVGIRPVWSESSLSAWRKLGSLATHWAHSEGSDQTGQMPKLISVFAGRTVTLLVLSCCGSSFKCTDMLLNNSSQLLPTDWTTILDNSLSMVPRGWITIIDVIFSRCWTSHRSKPFNETERLNQSHRSQPISDSRCRTRRIDQKHKHECWPKCWTTITYYGLSMVPRGWGIIMDHSLSMVPRVWTTIIDNSLSMYRDADPQA